MKQKVCIRASFFADLPDINRILLLPESIFKILLERTSIPQLLSLQLSSEKFQEFTKVSEDGLYMDSETLYTLFEGEWTRKCERVLEGSSCTSWPMTAAELHSLDPESSLCGKVDLVLNEESVGLGCTSWARRVCLEYFLCACAAHGHARQAQVVLASSRILGISISLYMDLGSTWKSDDGTAVSSGNPYQSRLGEISGQLSFLANNELREELVLLQEAGLLSSVYVWIHQADFAGVLLDQWGSLLSLERLAVNVCVPVKVQGQGKTGAFQDTTQFMSRYNKTVRIVDQVDSVTSLDTAGSIYSQMCNRLRVCSVVVSQIACLRGCTMPEGRTLTYLDLSGNFNIPINGDTFSLSNNHIVLNLICKSVSTTLQFLSLSRTLLSPDANQGDTRDFMEELEDMSEQIKFMGKLSRLDVSYNSGIPGTCLSVMISNPCLKDVDVSGCPSLASTGCLETLRKSASHGWNSLRFASANVVRASSLTMVISSLCQDSDLVGLQALDISDTWIDVKVAHAIRDLLIHPNCRLERLVMRRDHTGAAGGADAGAALSITGDALCAVLMGIQSNTTLELWDASGHVFNSGDDATPNDEFAVHCLGAILKNHPTLSVIKLDQNHGLGSSISLILEGMKLYSGGNMKVMEPRLILLARGCGTTGAMKQLLQDLKGVNGLFVYT